MTDYAALVEPRLGNRIGRWISFAAACRPFGLVALSPDTRDGEWGGGYNLADDGTIGFSHLHDWQSGGVRIMPVVGEVDYAAGPSAFKSPFSHVTEICKPGDHRLTLERFGVGVELTATARVGLHRYTFPTGEAASIILDLVTPCGPCEMKGAELREIGPHTFAGRVTNAPTLRKPKSHDVHFALEFDHPVELGPFDPTQLRARFQLGSVETPVTLKVGISYTSIEAARENLRQEVGDRSFDEIREAARTEWNQWLGRIEVEGGDPIRRARFYTDLYFSSLGRRTASDFTGTYADYTGDVPVIRQIPLGSDGQPRYRHFNSDAFWGAQWSLVPLWSLVYPEILEEFCHCFMDIYRNGGLIPRGPAAGNYTFVMTSAQTTPMFACAMNNGIYRPDDLEEVYVALRKNHFPGGLMGKCGYEHTSARGGGIEDYLERGYIPEDLPKAGYHANGAAQTIEHAYNDWALAQVARSMGKMADAELLETRSKNYRNLFDAETGFCRPRDREGKWIEPFDPSGARGWTEANAWTFTFHAPHDVAGLIDCFGSEEKFFARLEEAFERSAEMQFFAPRDHHYLIPLDFGNEPALAIAHLFHLAGRPERTNYWLHRILNELKGGNSPDDSWGGDEDQGIMGAWNVLVSIGLFSATGACESPARFQITAPVFEQIRIHLNPQYFSGKVLEIRMKSSVVKPPSERTHSELTLGGILEIPAIQ